MYSKGRQGGILTIILGAPDFNKPTGTYRS